MDYFLSRRSLGGLECKAGFTQLGYLFGNIFELDGALENVVSEFFYILINFHWVGKPLKQQNIKHNSQTPYV